MTTRSSLLSLTLFSLVVLLVVAAFTTGRFVSSASAPTATPTATRAPESAPTATPAPAQPTSTPTPAPAQPTSTPTPAPAPGGDDDHQATTDVLVYLVGPDDGTDPERAALLCGSSLVPITYSLETETPLRAALQALLDDPGSHVLDNRLFPSNLTIDSVAIHNRHAEVYLSGELVLAGVCDEVLVAAQLYETALQFPTVDSAAFFVNGAPLESYFLRGQTPVEPVPVPENPNEPGSISGELGYPSEGVPVLDVYAISVNDPNFFYHLTTVPGQTTFDFIGVQPGDYYVVAYLSGGDPTFAGAYSQAVVCGLTVECTDHTLIPVTVFPGEHTVGVQVFDWYAGTGVFPARPTGAGQPLE